MTRERRRLEKAMAAWTVALSLYGDQSKQLQMADVRLSKAVRAVFWAEHVEPRLKA